MGRHLVQASARLPSYNPQGAEDALERGHALPLTNILITGESGFIGSHLADRLACNPDNKVTILDLCPRLYGDLPPCVRFVQGNLGEYSLIRRILENYRIQVIYHAAWANIAETALKNIHADINVSLLPSVSLLNASCDAGVKRVIFLSSGGAVYGIPQSLPVDEKHPTDPINPYGVTKLAVEKYLRMYFHIYGLEYIIVRPSAPYGPRQIPNRKQGVVSEFIYRALKNNVLTVWGDGDKIIRDYIYIDDLTNAMMLIKDLPFQEDRILNLSGSIKYSLNDIIRIIKNVLHLAPRVQYEKPRHFDVPCLHLDIGLAAKVLAWQPRISIEEGIAHTADWIKNNIK
jgi:UDP-glucose 4-epimerase